MTVPWKPLVAAATALVLSACSHSVTGTAVSAVGPPPPASATDGDESLCATVDLPLEDIPAENAREPHLRIPVPDGWERNAMMDSQIIRYTIVSTDLVADRFATNAVVTLESARGDQTPEEVFAQNRANLETMMGAFDLDTRSNTTCGLPSETTHYMAPPLGPAPERPIIMHAVVAEVGRTTYLATVTIQTTDPVNPRYIKESQQIVDGFQMLLPSS
ncbi:LpqN/LpqT family lipoprotein [Mycobacterium sp. ITM-2016-00317]|uniref:LpqN/LpqT family lipoprotein n=1 Tax=Mycobacterium sp. ITM-2016-00317 TaxID=2099694 RepID=UPI000D487DC7|nr:LpqN/LpqT family lipoprotein [Mycobacterium sp. ITM-2016-00317]WNG88308.1 LpqN/LpqT family lipoprotein [Mycobacterium sp. ITM-2016-00317]